MFKVVATGTWDAEIFQGTYEECQAKLKEADIERITPSNVYSAQNLDIEELTD